MSRAEYIGKVSEPRAYHPMLFLQQAAVAMDILTGLALIVRKTLRLPFKKVRIVLQLSAAVSRLMIEQDSTWVLVWRY